MASGEIVFLEGDKGARFPDANSIFVDDEIPTVIDPATRREDLERLENELGIKMVIDTHYHIDHIRYNCLFPDAEIVAHPLDAPAISSLGECASIVGVARMPWVEAWKNTMRKVHGYIETDVTRTLSDGEETSLGENTIRVIHTPGHTPGHLCLQFVEKRAVFLADIDLTSFGPWYGNKSSSVDEFLSSIERLKTVDADTWYTSHEEGIIEGDITGRLDAFAEVIHDRERRILDFLSNEHSFDEIVDEALIYGKRWEPEQMFDFIEGTMLEKHLARLQRDGLIGNTDGGWVAL